MADVVLDPTKMKDWEIARAAESRMTPFMTLGRSLGLRDDELIPMGRCLGKVDFARVMERLRDVTVHGVFLLTDPPAACGTV